MSGKGKAGKYIQSSKKMGKLKLTLAKLEKEERNILPLALYLNTRCNGFRQEPIVCFGWSGQLQNISHQVIPNL